MHHHLGSSRAIIHFKSVPTKNEGFLSLQIFVLALVSN